MNFEGAAEGACRMHRFDHAAPAKNSGWDRAVRKNAEYSEARSWSYVVHVAVDGVDEVVSRVRRQRGWMEAEAKGRPPRSTAARRLATHRSELDVEGVADRHGVLVLG